ncbi:bifunctional glycosyltransferase/CDP-glycerol:glycerophosphate glycerophosphotransferase [Marinobacter sp. JSM 1782161]|uniref:bifunctional glycosyltransferase/CDP-glycerol:glycerophosphate glycerophosphotransferase n=1 Tax=Marinobacter sp. JSM 1782161 TaxID=2685906 RepID=UPI001402E52E|nr:glycosyltransferase [Marinobacter sp. JSM 1782161]
MLKVAYPLVSVIVPLYNTRDFIVECLDSVLSQSQEKVEILVVDDGSEDGGDGIVEDYAKKHSFIQLFRQDRKRQGAARNLALDHANGRYVSFLDSDDTLPVDALKNMVEVAERCNSDMVCGIQQSFSQWRRWVGVPVHQREFNRLIERTTLEEMPSLIQDISACNRLIRRETIEKHAMRFPEGTAGEDLDFMARMYLNCDVISIVPEVVYNYRGRTDSRTSRISTQFFEDRVAVTEGLESSFGQKDALHIYKRLLRSEVRKLVGNRFKRVINQASYDEQLAVFDIVGRLIGKLSPADMRSADDFSLHEQIRIIMLSGREYEALVAYETAPHSPRYLHLLKSEVVKAQLFEPMMQLQYEGVGQYEKLAQLQRSRVFRRLSGLALSGLRVVRVLRHTQWRPMFLFLVARVLSGLRGWVTPTQKSNWLMDERVGSSAEDNGYFFFKYVRENQPSVPLYYVIDKRSPHRDRVSGLGQVVDRYSFRHAWLLCTARVLLSTDSFRGLAYPFELFPRFYEDTLNVFLQHGVAGNKTMNYTRANYPYFSKIVISNRIEQAFLTEPHYGFRPDQLMLTGIARLDNLPTEPPAEPRRKILVAPTWRRWLRGQDAIRTSRYYHAWNSLVTSPELAALLEEFGFELYFRPHFNMMHFIDEFESGAGRVHILRNLDEPLHQMIVEADVLVTDYSSVMYDFFYQHKPVIGYMFDRVEWEAQPPGPPHLDYAHELALDITETQDEVLSKLRETLANQCFITDEQKRRVAQLFEYRDGGNCERTFRAVVAAQEEAEGAREQLCSN